MLNFPQRKNEFSDSLHPTGIFVSPITKMKDIG
ncbi:Uncharacterised protein [Vibrio cholerae]|nr:Uncharacterised protein [Vibrio cholerae]